MARLTLARKIAFKSHCLCALEAESVVTITQMLRGC